jgi:spore photoproduct lyase
MVDAAGKLSYPFEVKEELFQTVWKAFTPWHDAVFFYCCMEDPLLWDRLFGFHYETNAQFENALFDALCEKLQVAA